MRKVMKKLAMKIPQIKRLVEERDSYFQQMLLYQKENNKNETKLYDLYHEMDKQRVLMQKNLEKAIAEREEKITALYQEMDEQRISMQKNLDQAIVEREEKIATLYAKMENQRVSMQDNLNRAIAERERKIANLYREMDEQRISMQKNLNQAVAEREEKIVALYEELERQRISMQNNLDQAIAEREEKIKALYEELERQRIAMQKNLYQAIKEREEKIKVLNREIEHITARNGMHKIEQLHEIQMADACFSSEDFWEKHYQGGGNSGTGSYKHLAQFKSDVINNFIKENGINTLIDLGCGDGNIVSMLSVPYYTGIDVSPTIISKNREKFKDDQTKNFYCSSEREKYTHQRYDLSLSMDVIFHLVEDEVFFNYMNDLFSLAEKYVIIYSSNHEEFTMWREFRHRNFTGYVIDKFPDWEIFRYIPNKYPYIIGKETESSVSDFYIYHKK